MTGWSRFWSKVLVDDATGCWLWQGRLDADGYGRFMDDGRNVRAHRYAWDVFRDEWEPLDWTGQLELDHTCRVRNCVNPAHLRQVTARENTLAGVGPAAVNARKTACIHGHPLDGVVALKSGPQTGRRMRYCRTCKRERARDACGTRKGAPKDPPTPPIRCVA